jgi:hypothetical protein
MLNFLQLRYSPLCAPQTSALPIQQMKLHSSALTAVYLDPCAPVRLSKHPRSAAGQTGSLEDPKYTTNFKLRYQFASLVDGLQGRMSRHDTKRRPPRRPLGAVCSWAETQPQ